MFKKYDFQEFANNFITNMTFLKKHFGNLTHIDISNNPIVHYDRWQDYYRLQRIKISIKHLPMFDGSWENTNEYRGFNGTNKITQKILVRKNLII